MDLATMRGRVAALVPYQRRVRPCADASFAPFVDAELQRIDVTTRAIVQALKDLDVRLAALGG